jgi:TolB protein
MNVDGSGVIRLTDDPANDMFPAWSPDGQQIAFASGRDGNWEIYVMDADGGGVQNLTNNPAEDFSPSWSPDGTRIAFGSDRDNNWEIYIMAVGGSGLSRMTNNSAEDDRPTWSPDGARLAFASTRDDPDPAHCGTNCNYEIYVMNADGSDVVRLTNSPAVDWEPAWSPQ